MEKANKQISLLSLVLIALVIFWSFSDLKPSANHFSNDESGFSLENVKSHLKVISKEAHHVGTPTHREVRDYLMDELKKLGLESSVQTQTIFRERGLGTTVENIIARIEGSGNGKALMLLSHYDSSVPHSKGASDDGSGIATILEGLRVFLQGDPPKNDIIVLFSDAEELGLLGARAFIKYHEWNQDVGLILNFEARGSGGPSFMLMETNGKNSKLLKEFLAANPSYPATSSLSYSVYKMLPNDTDLTPFREISDINGYNFAFIDDHFDYHTAQDAFDRLDASTLAHQGDYLMSTLSYFANSDISDLNSDSDLVFINFPLVKMLTYPFSWNNGLFTLACLGFIALIWIGIKRGTMDVKEMLKGFVPFLISLLVCILLTIGLWKLILIVHPSYQDMLQGFTYNGYHYITGFVALNAWLFLWIYGKFKSDVSYLNLLVAPIVFWLIVNVAVLLYLPGAAFFIIPVFMALAIAAISVFKELPAKARITAFVVLSIPMLYMLSPMVKLFPVALGLNMLAISAFFTVLMLGLLLPVLKLMDLEKELKLSMGGLALLFFVLATLASGFNSDRKKPTNITFYYNADNDVSYWASRNSGMDEYVSQFLGQDPQTGPLPAEAGMGSSAIRFHKKTENRAIEISDVNIHLDTLIGEERTLEFTITPQRKVHRYELYSNGEQEYSNFTMNGELVGDGSLARSRSRLIARYTMANADSLLRVSFSVKKNMIPDFRIFETSYDLETNSLFEVEAKPDYMMPFAFVTGDAIVAIYTPNFDTKDDK